MASCSCMFGRLEWYSDHIFSFFVVCRFVSLLYLHLIFCNRCSYLSKWSLIQTTITVTHMCIFAPPPLSLSLFSLLFRTSQPIPIFKLSQIFNLTKKANKDGFRSMNAPSFKFESLCESTFPIRLSRTCTLTHLNDLPRRVIDLPSSPSCDHSPFSIRHFKLLLSSFLVFSHHSLSHLPSCSFSPSLLPSLSLITSPFFSIPRRFTVYSRLPISFIYLSFYSFLC